MSLRNIRVLVVDHNALLREGLAVLVRLQSDMELIGAVATVEDAVACVRKHRPDVTLMDLDLPAGAAITAIQEILEIDPGTCVLGLFTYEADETGTRALRAGARNCLTKDRLNEDLIAMVRNCARSNG